MNIIFNLNNVNKNIHIATAWALGRNVSEITIS